MNQVVVTYWSGSGNTQEMARADRTGRAGCRTVRERDTGG